LRNKVSQLAKKCFTLYRTYTLFNCDNELTFFLLLIGNMHMMGLMITVEVLKIHNFLIMKYYILDSILY